MKKNDAETAGVYAALDRFIDRCLRNRKSLVIEDEPAASEVWTVASTQELIDRFVENPDEGAGTFIEKLRVQLADTSPLALQLMVELTWLHVVVSRFYKPETKQRIVSEIAEIGNATVPGGLFEDAYSAGIASTGMSFVTRRPHQLWLLIRFAHAWLQMDRAENQRLLEDPWAFRALVFGLEGIGDQSQRHALIHLIHPETFEGTVSQYHKRDIVLTFSPAGAEYENDDRGIAAVRDLLAPKYGEDFDFYDERLRSQWLEETDDGSLPPDAGSSDPDDVVPLDDRQAWLVRGQGGDRVPEWLERGICAVYFEDAFPFAVEPGVSKSDIRLSADEAGVDTSAGGFNGELGQVWRFVNEIEIGDYLLTVDGQDIYLGEVASGPKSIGGRGRRETVRSVEWLNQGAPVKRGDVSAPLYAKLRTLLTLSNITSVLGDLERWANGRFPGELEEDEERPPTVAFPPADAAMAKALHLPADWLNGIIDLLADKKQLVFYGPPGTGKTYLAQELADHLTDAGGSTELVQFHPSYTYEDFFEGYRPVVATGGTIAFEIKPGPLRRIADAARRDPGAPYVLIIDEINRANLAKVFGELYFLLEYRDRGILLQYADDEEFTLPENLFVIGTMNTADRSIALVDSAMRRRFYFVEMAPTASPINALLRKWLDAEKLDSSTAALLDEVNRRIDDPDAAIGPSYLMTRSIAEPGGLERIWEHAIMPLLRERFYGTGDDVGHLELAAIRKAIEGPAEP